MWVLIAVLAVPLIEIGLFVEIGGAIGLWPTLAWVILTAAFGIMLIRQQGMAQAVRLRSGLREIDPLSPMVHGVLKIVAAMLLILPGFLTDSIGLLLLIPPVRSLFVAALARRVTVRPATGYRREPHRPDPGIIDGEFTEIDPDQSVMPPTSQPPRRPSGWSQGG